MSQQKKTTLRMLIEQIVKEEIPINRKLEGQVATSQALSYEFGLSDAKVAALMHTSKRTAFNHRKALANVRAWGDRTPENKKAAIERARKLLAVQETMHPRPKSFKFTTDIFRLNRMPEFDFRSELTDGELQASDTVRITYDSATDTLTGVVTGQNADFGHIFEPTGFNTDPDLVTALYNIRNDD